MPLMYDSTNPADIPTTAPIVAGYIDGLYKWSPADWARFPNAKHVTIAVSPDTNDGMVLDVENGDATPDQAPGWCSLRRFAGVKPTIYCSASSIDAVVKSFEEQSVPQPMFWVADWTGHPHLYPGSVATQYANPPASGGNYDSSMTNDVWPDGVTPAPTPQPTPQPAPGGTVSVTLPILSQNPNPQSHVKTLQTLLNANNAWLHVDGIFGPATEQAVKNFQSFWHLAVDGIVGENTWNTLLAVG